jgi:hypothetical protein
MKFKNAYKCLNENSPPPLGDDLYTHLTPGVSFEAGIGKGSLIELFIVDLIQYPSGSALGRNMVFRPERPLHISPGQRPGNG